MIALSSHSIRFQLAHTQQLLNASPRIFPKLFQIFITRNMSTNQLAYQPPSIDNIEDVENYRKGGFHPVRLGDAFSRRRYRVLHKLGFGGSSTVWLARDELSQRLVSLKILTAERSDACAEPEILRYLQNNPSHTLGREYILPLHDCFHIEGPNGCHTCLVSLFAGPSLSQLSESPGQPGGCRRLRGNAARQIAKQVGLAIEFLHSQGVVHGGIYYYLSTIILRVHELTPICYRPHRIKYSFPAGRCQMVRSRYSKAIRASSHRESAPPFCRTECFRARIFGRAASDLRP